MSVIKPFLAMAVAAGFSALASISFPGGEKGIGFDDLGFAPGISRVLVPGGRTGKLMLIDPADQKIETIEGFSAGGSYGGGHGEGITSADEGRGVIFVTDRSAKQLTVVDEESRRIVAKTPLGSGPDYVRFVAETNEVWVTEPRAKGIEIFALPTEGTPRPVHVGFVEVPGGPESLIIDHARHRAYTNLWSDSSLAIDLKDRKIAARWPNGCKDSRGIALDEKRGFLFVGCDEGKASVLDVTSGKRLAEASSGAGVDIIAYNSSLAHLYVPGGDSATMTTMAIAADGHATVLGSVATARDAHCVISGGHDKVYVCDPERGRILVFQDSMPTSH